MPLSRIAHAKALELYNANNDITAEELAMEVSIIEELTVEEANDLWELFVMDMTDYEDHTGVYPEDDTMNDNQERNFFHGFGTLVGAPAINYRTRFTGNMNVFADAPGFNHHIRHVEYENLAHPRVNEVMAITVDNAQIETEEMLARVQIDDSGDAQMEEAEMDDTEMEQTEESTGKAYREFGF